MDDTPVDQQVLGMVIKALVKYPDQVHVDRRVDNLGALLSVHVAKEDMPLVIGRAGKTADSLRVIVHCLGRTIGVRTSMKIVEPEAIA
jgi:hypothetical protein